MHTIRHYLDLLESVPGGLFESFALLEDRLDYLRKQSLERLDKIKDNVRVPPSLGAKLDGSDGVDSSKLFDFIVSLDPTKEKKQAQWLMNTFVKGGWMLEDWQKARDYLIKWNKMKKDGTLPSEAKDLNRFRSPAELFKAIDIVDEQLDTVPKEDVARARAESDTLFEDATVLVVIPKTEFAAKVFGHDSQWCTAYGYEHGVNADKDDNMFDRYKDDGPIFIIRDKTDPKMSMQWQPGSKQYMDLADDMISPERMLEWLRAHPEPAALIAAMSPRMVSIIGRLGWDYLVAMGYGSPEKQVDLVNISASLFSQIPNPSAEAQKAMAVMNYGEYLLDLKNINPEAARIAVSKDKSLRKKFQNRMKIKF